MNDEKYNWQLLLVCIQLLVLSPATSRISLHSELRLNIWGEYCCWAEAPVTWPGNTPDLTSAATDTQTYCKHILPPSVPVALFSNFYKNICIIVSYKTVTRPSEHKILKLSRRRIDVTSRAILHFLILIEVVFMFVSSLSLNLIYLGHSKQQKDSTILLTGIFHYFFW